MKNDNDIEKLNAPDDYGVTPENLDNFVGDGQVAPLHPGIVFKRWVVDKNGLNEIDVSEGVGMPVPYAEKLLRGELDVTEFRAEGMAEIAGNDPDFWLREQRIYDLWHQRNELAPHGDPISAPRPADPGPA